MSVREACAPAAVYVHSGTPGSGPPQPWNVQPVPRLARPNRADTAAGDAHRAAAARSPAVHALSTDRAASVGSMQTIPTVTDGPPVVDDALGTVVARAGGLWDWTWLPPPPQAVSSATAATAAATLSPGGAAAR
jgi:hypothetical protein